MHGWNDAAKNCGTRSLTKRCLAAWQMSGPKSGNPDAIAACLRRFCQAQQKVRFFASIEFRPSAGGRGTRLGRSVARDCARLLFRGAERRSWSEIFAKVMGRQRLVVDLVQSRVRLIKGANDRPGDTPGLPHLTAAAAVVRRQTAPRASGKVQMRPSATSSCRVHLLPRPLPRVWSRGGFGSEAKRLRARDRRFRRGCGPRGRALPAVRAGPGSRLGYLR